MCPRSIRHFSGWSMRRTRSRRYISAVADGTIEREVYVLSLIEHKSEIDYDVAMQLLRYMSVIWQEYKATTE